jgi:hypothetical protein
MTIYSVIGLAYVKLYGHIAFLPCQMSGHALQKSHEIATCSLTRVQCRTRVKHLDTYSLTRVLRVSNVHVTNCTV